MSVDPLLRGIGAALVLTWMNSAGATPTLDVQPSQVRPGDALLISIHGATHSPQGTAGDRRLAFYPISGGFQALVGLPIEARPGPLPVRIGLVDEAGSPPELTSTITVAEPQFRSKELSVAPRFIKPPASVKRRIREDQAAFRRAFAQRFVPPLFSDNFTWPRPPEFTGRFGDQRVFNGQKQSQHYGDDIRGAMGDPVVASNDGKIVLVRDCYYSGLTVVLYHGADLFSVYFHLLHSDVREGQQVKRGSSLGKVGSSGRSTGPHLHLGFKLAGLYVDPASVLRLPFGGPSVQPDSAEPSSEESDEDDR